MQRYSSLLAHKGSKTMLGTTHPRQRPGARRRASAGFILSLLSATVVLVALCISSAVATAATSTAVMLTISPSGGLPGDALTVTGVGFPKFASVLLTWNGSSAGMPRANVRGNGSFVVSVTVPNQPHGDYTLAATAAGLTASTVVQVFASTTPTTTSTATPSPIPTSVRTMTPTPTATSTPVSAGATPGRTFYVSPTGSDSNPGTATQPWRTFYNAAATLQAGDTAIFADGIYNETQYRAYTAFANSGTGTPGNADYLPITIRAEHPRQAILNFSNKPGGVNSTAVWIGTSDPTYARKNIVLQDLTFTQPSMGSNYSDGLVRCWIGSDNCQLIGNEFHNAYEPVKASGNSGTILDGNLFADANVHFGAFGANRITIRNNEFENPTDTAIQTKGGTVDAQVYDNYIHTTGTKAMSTGIYLGGGSCGTPCGVTNVVTGYEGDHVVAYNNIVAGSTGAPISYGGIVFEGCNDCTALNNDTVNAAVAVRMIANGGWSQPDGSIRYVPTTNPVVENNIVYSCTNPVFYSTGPTPSAKEITGSITVDYNDFYGCGSYGMPIQAHPVTGDPLFVDPLSDWHLRSGSSAIGSGTVGTYTGYYGESIDVSLNRDGVQRSQPWNLGAY